MYVAKLGFDCWVTIVNRHTESIATRSHSRGRRASARIRDRTRGARRETDDCGWVQEHALKAAIRVRIIARERRRQSGLGRGTNWGRS